MDEVNRDDYGLKAGGVLYSLENLETFFGIKLAHLLFLFGAAEERFFKQKIPLCKKLSQL